jgi:hypothetical protein
MTALNTLKQLGLAAAAAATLTGTAIAGPIVSGPETLWLAQTDGATTEGNAGAMQLQDEIVMKLRAIGIEYPDGQFMTMEQVDKLMNLFNLGETEAVARDQAKLILGM